jgi:hypothetical protein
MHRSIICLLVCLCTELWCQVPFAAVQQLPILQNTSFAGSKNSRRWVLAYNQSRERSYRVSSQYISYDGFWARKKVGFAIHLLNSASKEKGNFDHLQTFKTLFKNDLFSASYPFTKSERMLGICIAPKYNLALDKSHQKASYTLSPSIGVDIVSQKQVLMDHWNMRTARDLQADTTYYLVDSLDFVESNTQSTQMRLNAGLKLNSKRFILSYLFSYTYDWITEEYLIHEGSIYHNHTDTRTSSLKHRIPSHAHWFTGAYAFFKRERSNFSLFGGLGLRQFVGKSRYSNPNKKWNSLYASDKARMDLISQYYLAGVFRYHKILMGGTFSAFDKFKTYGINLGYQNNAFRVFTTFNALPKSYSTVEVVLSFLGLGEEGVKTLDRY